MSLAGSNLSIFSDIQSQSIADRGTLISPVGTGLWEICFFICSNRQLKVKLTVCRTLCPIPEPDAFFCIR